MVGILLILLLLVLYITWCYCYYAINTSLLGTIFYPCLLNSNKGYFHLLESSSSSVYGVEVSSAQNRSVISHYYSYKQLMGIGAFVSWLVKVNELEHAITEVGGH